MLGAQMFSSVLPTGRSRVQVKKPKPMMLRRLACRLLERHPAAVAALGALGMAGFVGTLVLAINGWAAARSSFWFGLCALLSLFGYGLSLLIGHLGDPFELRRREDPVRAGKRASRPRIFQPLDID